MNIDDIEDGHRCAGRKIALSASPLQPQLIRSHNSLAREQLMKSVKANSGKKVNLRKINHTNVDEGAVETVLKLHGSNDGKSALLAPVKTPSLTRASSSAPSLQKPKNEAEKSRHLLDTFLALQVAGALPRTEASNLTERTICLPPPTKEKTVVFDLDETLVHRCDDTQSAEAIIPIFLPSGEQATIGVNIRPYAVHCLQELSKNWEVIVFTASQRCYADAVLDYLEKGRGLVTHRLYREHCSYYKSVPVKDLRMLPHRNLHSTVIIDNAACNFAYQLDNGIPIRPWKSNLKDRELVKLTRFLKQLYNVKDVRTELRKTFDLEHFCEDFKKALKPKRKGSYQL